MEFENEEAQLLIQRVLGQLLFYPPNVAGWPGGKNWIDSSSLMFRLNIPYVLANAGDFYINAKDDDDNMMGMRAESDIKANGVQTTVNWDPVIKAFQDVPRENLLKGISNVLLQTQSKVTITVLERHIDKQSKENYIKATIVKLMSTPEYQLC
jgi:hypothetical protein